MKKDANTKTAKPKAKRTTSTATRHARPTREERKERFLEAFAQAKGVVSTACKGAGIGRPTFYVWMKQDAEFAERVRVIEEEQIDGVESALISRIDEGDTTAIIFYLKTKGKRRGYSERLEVTGKDGGELLPPRVLTKEEAKALFAQLESDC